MALSSSLYLSEYPEKSIRSVVQILPRTSDFMIYNDFNNEDCKPIFFPERVKEGVAGILRNDLRLSHVYPPKQPTSYPLYAAHFSASAVKFGLLDEDFIYSFTRLGLQLSAAKSFKSRARSKEVGAIGVIGACLQLITAGSVFMEKHFAKTDGLANVIAALEALRVKNVVTHPRGLELLEVGSFNFAPLFWLTFTLENH